MNYINAKIATMTIDNIKTFIAVYRAGSFVEVANDRNVAPSSVSRAIASLEANLKTRLFQRTTRNLTPTQEGEEYFRKILLANIPEMISQNILGRSFNKFMEIILTEMPTTLFKMHSH